MHTLSHTHLIAKALGDIDVSFLEEAIAFPPKKVQPSLPKRLAAACLCLLIGVTSLCTISFPAEENPASIDSEPALTPAPEPSQSVSGVTPPAPQLSLAAEENASMMPFFIYQGRTYLYYDCVPSRHLALGEKAGTATGLIDEWTPQDGYVNLAGSVTGDFYPVAGYDPSFLLAMPQTDGTMELFVAQNGYTLQTGADLFQTRLSVLETCTAVTWETWDSWYEEKGDIHTLSTENTAAFSSFLGVLEQSPCCLTESIPLIDGAESVYDFFFDDWGLYHLYITRDDGITVELCLFEGGYIMFSGLQSVCVQVPPDDFSALLALLS